MALKLKDEALTLLKFEEPSISHLKSVLFVCLVINLDNALNKLKQ